MNYKLQGDKNTKISLLVIGDYAWDVIIETRQQLLAGGDVMGDVRIKAGGSAANTAVWASRCGLPVTFIGKIGKDPFGRMARENMEKEGVDAVLIESDKHATEAVAVWVGPQGKRSMVSGKGADFYLQPDEIPENILNRTDHLYISAWSLFTDPPRAASLYAADRVRKAGGQVSLDPASFQMITSLGVEYCIDLFNRVSPRFFFPNYEEGKVLTAKTDPEEIVEELAGLFPDTIICLKLDENGALISERGSLFHLAPVKCRAKDDTGAGDAFAGAFLAEYLRYGSILNAGEIAVHVSSWVVNRLGARPDMAQALQQEVDKLRLRTTQVNSNR